MSAAPSQANAASARHYGLDWLRIAAFGLLIVYHIAMVFAPWPWVIKTPHAYPALIAPMALLTPWRLALLFAVSGYASRKLFDRFADPAAFARSRARRLLIPLAFGMAAIVPLEMWVRVREHGYPFGYLHFWAVDYWHVTRFYGVPFPSWEHLWFVAYLASYTLLLAALLQWRGAAAMRAMAHVARWLSEAHRLVWAPAALLATLRLALLFVAPERQGLLVDWGGHSQYVPEFLFGFVLAGTPSLWPVLARNWRGALMLVLACVGPILFVELAYPGATVPPHAVMALDRAARSGMAWGMILLLFAAAERWWNHDHRWRKPLAEAVFPFYIVHHPAIVLLTWYSLPWQLGPGAEFLLLLTGTGAVCAASYGIGSRIGWLRPLIGLSPRLAAPAASAKAAAAMRSLP